MSNPFNPDPDGRRRLAALRPQPLLTPTASTAPIAPSLGTTADVDAVLARMTPEQLAEVAAIAGENPTPERQNHAIAKVAKRSFYEELKRSNPVVAARYATTHGIFDK